MVLLLLSINSFCYIPDNESEQPVLGWNTSKDDKDKKDDKDEKENKDKKYDKDNKDNKYSFENTVCMYRNYCLFEIPIQKPLQNSQFVKIRKSPKPLSLIYLTLGVKRGKK